MTTVTIRNKYIIIKIIMLMNGINIVNIIIILIIIMATILLVTTIIMIMAITIIIITAAMIIIRKVINEKITKYDNKQRSRKHLLRYK